MNGGIAARRHANGRDWWVAQNMIQIQSIKFFLRQQVLQSITTQKLIVPKAWYSIFGN